MKDQLIALAIQEIPTVIETFKNLFTTQNPGVPAPTEAEVMAALSTAFISSLAKDEAWLAAHPA